MRWQLSRRAAIILTLAAIAAASLAGSLHSSDPAVTVVAHGESITEGYPLAKAQAFPALLEKALNAAGASVSVINAGHGGAGFSNPGSRHSNLTDEARDVVDRYAGPRAVLILLASSNDIFLGKSAADTYALFEAYLSARLRAGWLAGNIIVCTILPRERLSEDERSAYNASLVSGQRQYTYSIARLDQDPRIGQPGAYKDRTYWESDQVHPNARGHEIIASVIYPVLLPIVSRLHSPAAR